MKLIDVGIEITSECNRSCSYCPRSLGPLPDQGEMSEDVFCRILDELSKIEFKGRICYNLFGEPLLSSKLEFFVDLARQRLPLATSVLFTNGTLLSKERFTSLVSHGVKFFIVTKHEKVERLPLEDYLEELPEELRKKIYFQDYNKLCLSNRSGLLPQLNQGKHLFPLRFPCKVPLLGAYFSVSGNLLPCHDDYSQRYIIGNIKDEGLEALRNKKDFVRFCSELQKGHRGEFDLCRFCSSEQLLPL